MFKKALFFLLLFVFINACKSERKKASQAISDTTLKTPVKEKEITETKQKAYHWVNNLHFDMDYIAKKNLGDKKHLAELLGVYWKLYKTTDNALFKKEIKQKAQPHYNYTKSSKYHNMLRVDNKLFKKNSMSYLRVMWLLKELDFDITAYNKEVLKVKKRMGAHLKNRGDWQKEVFKEYYQIFNYKLPPVLKNSKRNNGLIDSKLDFKKYTKNKAYNFTHFVFAAFEYGNKVTQERFDKEDVQYIKDILPKFTHYYREVKPNIDLLGEFFTCMVYIGELNNTDEFQKTYQYLLDNQNTNGSWGNYEKHRNKLGNDVDFRAYLHTTLVVLEGLLEYNEGNYKGSINK